MLISSYINLPFGRWAYCQYPAVVEARTFHGKIKMGSDLLVLDRAAGGCLRP